MRIAKILFILFGILIAALLVGSVVFLKTFEIDKFKPQIIAKASEALGRAVDFKDIDLDVTLKNGVRLNLTSLVIGDDPAFGSDPFLKVEDIFLGVDLMTFVTKREVAVSSVQIKAPQVRLVRAADGRMNVASIGQKGSVPGPSGAPAPVVPAERAGSSAAGAPSAVVLPPISIETIKLEGGVITVIDKSVSPEVNMQISPFAFRIDGFNLQRPFHVVLVTSLFSQEKNIRLEGKVGLDLAGSRAKFQDFTFETDLSQLSMERLRRSVPVPEDTPLPDVLAGQFRLNVKESTVGAGGVESLTADLSWDAGKIRFKQIAPGVSLDLPVVILQMKGLSFEHPFQLSVQAAYLNDQPNILADGTVSLDPPSHTIHVKDMKVSARLGMFDLAKLKASVSSLKDVPLPDKLSGEWQAEIKKLTTSPEGVVALRMDSSLTGGEVSFKELAPGVGFRLSQIALNVRDLSFEDVFGYDLRASYLSDQPNISSSGKVKLDRETQSVTLSGAAFDADLATFVLEQLRSSLAALKDAPLPENLQGKVHVEMDEVAAGPKGLTSLRGAVTLKDGAVKMPQMIVPAQAIQAKLAITPETMDIQNCSLSLGKGTVTVTGNVSDYLKTQAYRLTADMQGIDLAEVLDQKDQPVKLEGVVFGAFTAAGEGFSPEALGKTLNGDGGLQLKNGRLKDLNILKLVIDKMSIIPNFGEKIEASLPEKYQKKLTEKDTILNKVKVTAAVRDGIITFEPAEIDADGFLFNGNGRMTFAQKVDFSGSFIIPADMSASMAEITPELKYLFSPEGAITFPLKVTGQVPNIVPLPDLSSLASTVIRNKGKEELMNVLDKVLNKGEAQPAGDPNAPAPQQEKAPEQEILEGILDGIFK